MSDPHRSQETPDNRITPAAIAERVNAHVRWLASEGQEGARLVLREIDLSGLDLRGADLRHAELQACRLEATDLREARLDFADLSTVTHLLAGQLAGADVAGARLPPEIHVFERLEHIHDLTVGGRKVFLFMLLAIAYTWLTIATTSDVELLTNAATSPLPIILTELPLAGFYWAAPLVLLGFYVYFHLHLQYLWEGLASLPAVFPDGRKLDDKAHPWLLTGLVNAHVRYLRETRPALSRVQNGLSIVLAWYVAPLTMAAVWLRYLPRHDPIASGFQMLMLMLAAAAGIVSYRLATKTLRGSSRRFPLVYVETAIIAIVFGLLPLLSYGAIAAGPPRYGVDPRAWTPRLFELFGYSVFANFKDMEVSHRPELWSDTNPPFDMVRGVNLQNADLYRADAAGAFLAKADLRNAKLRSANLELADLRRAKLQGADLSEANLLQADFRASSLQSADLRKAAMVLADLQEADLQRADLRGAFLSRANLRGADLFRADLRDVVFKDADLRNAKLELAIMAGADLRGANLVDAIGLDCFQLQTAQVDETTQMPEDLECQEPDKPISGR